MGKKAGIILSVVLSLMFVYVSAGVAILKCCCHDDMVVSMAKDDCCGSDAGMMKGKSCDIKKPCMKLTVIKLSPTVAAQKQAQVLPCTFAALLPDVLSDASRLLSFNNVSQNLLKNERRTGPPREYLTLLRVLRL